MSSEADKARLMTELAKTFPALASKFQDAADNGLSPWDVPTLINASKPWSGAEKLVVSFLFSVWNSYDAHEWAEPFNVVDALKRWDKLNWQAFARWTANPFHC